MRRRTVDLAGGDARQLMGSFAGTLAAIALGASSMGALTYIGNAPNLFDRRHRGRTRGRDAEFLRFHGWSSVILLPCWPSLAGCIASEDGSGPWGCLCRPESNDAEQPFLMRNIALPGGRTNLEGHSVAFRDG